VVDRRLTIAFLLNDDEYEPVRKKRKVE